MSLNDDALRKLYHAVEQSPMSVVITDTLGNIEYVNPKFEQVTGYGKDEVIGKNPRVLKSGETPGGEYARLWRTITSGGEWRGEFHNRRKDGHLYWELASISPVKDDTGKIISFIAVKEDITERKRIEQALNESEEKFRKITQAAKDGIVMIDDAGMVTFWNESATDIFGYDETEMLGKDLHRVLAPAKFEESHRKGLENFIRTGEGSMVGSTRELRALHKEGYELPIELSLSSVKIDEKWHGIGLVRDIRERQKAEKQAREAERDRVLIEMAGAAAHEINQPLSVISGLCQTLLELTEPESELGEDLKYMFEAAREIEHIVVRMQRLNAYKTKEYVGSARVVDLDGLDEIST